MSKGKVGSIWLAVFVFVLGLSITLLVFAQMGWPDTSEGYQLSDRIQQLRIIQDPQGKLAIAMPGDGSTLQSPEQWFAEVYQRQLSQQQGGRLGWLYRHVFDVTSWTGLVWVGFGLLAQAMFTGRMVLQWLASEKAGRSTVPIAFWWLSLIGATMLLAYFTWRVEIVGFLGQSTGWLIYSRNLWLIYFPAQPSPATTPSATASPS